MANPGVLLKGAKMLSKTPMGKKAKKKTYDMLVGMKKKAKKYVPSKYKKGGKGPGASTRTTKPAEVSKSFGQQQASTNNLMRDGMTKMMDATKLYKKVK
tara:strand:- start:118 stop:414 length:297 start_codon:yes stop_codon:yes gene_type:complete